MDNTQKSALLSLSLVLIAAGLGVLGFTLLEAYGAYMDLVSNRFVSELMKHVIDKPLLVGADTPLVLGEGGARLASVFLLLLLGWLGVATGLGLVRAGVHVLSPRFERQISELRERVDQLMNQVKR